MDYAVARKVLLSEKYKIHSQSEALMTGKDMAQAGGLNGLVIMYTERICKLLNFEAKCNRYHTAPS